MKKMISVFCILGLMNVGYAFADEAAHHDEKAEKAEHVVCADHDDHCKADEMGIEQTEHKYCDGHKEHCKKHDKKSSKKKTSK